MYLESQPVLTSRLRSPSHSHALSSTRSACTMRRSRSCTPPSSPLVSWILSTYAPMWSRRLGITLTLVRRQVSTQSTDAFANADKLKSAIDFTSDLLHEISPKFFESAETAESATEPPPEHLGFTLASGLYGAADMKTASLPETEGRELLTSGFATAVRLAETCAGALAGGNASASALLLSTLAIISSLADATAHSDEQLELTWKPEEWTDALVKCLAVAPARPAAFPVHAAIVKGILTLAQTESIRPGLQKNRRVLVEALTSKVRSSLTLVVQAKADIFRHEQLLEYLRPSARRASSSPSSSCGASRRSRTAATSSR